MATAKRSASKSKKTTTKKKATTRAKAGRPAGRPKGRAAGKPAAAETTSRAPISPLTGLPTREKIHLPIKGYGRYNSFQIVEQLYGKSTAELKSILAYEEKHQARRMVTDRIKDMLRRAGVKF